MGRDYMIAHFPKENERAIMRVNEDETWWLASGKVWTKHKERAKRFYHESDAAWALVGVRMSKWWYEEEKPYRPNDVAQSWGELSS